MSKSTICEHIYTHIKDVIPFKCGFCNACFSSKNGAVIHSKREHKGSPPLVVKNAVVDEDLYYSCFNQPISILKNDKHELPQASVPDETQGQPRRGSVPETSCPDAGADPAGEVPLTDRPAVPAAGTVLRGDRCLSVESATSHSTDQTGDPTELSRGDPTCEADQSHGSSADVGQTTARDAQEMRDDGELSPDEDDEDELHIYLPLTPERSTDSERGEGERGEGERGEGERGEGERGDGERGEEGEASRAPSSSPGKAVSTPVLTQILSTPPALAPADLLPGDKPTREAPAAEHTQPDSASLATPRDMTKKNVDPYKNYYQCRHCTHATQVEKSMQEHTRNKHPDDSRYTCPMRDSIYCKTQESVKKHFSRMHKGKPISYLKQPDYYLVRVDGAGTTDTANTTTILNVPSVTRRSTSPEEIDRQNPQDKQEEDDLHPPAGDHAPVFPQTAAGNTLYRCMTCSCTIADINAMIEHQDSVHKKNFWFACPYCPYGFSRHRINMQRHIRRAHPGRPAELVFGLVEQEKYFRPVSDDPADREHAANSNSPATGPADLNSDPGLCVNGQLEQNNNDSAAEDSTGSERPGRAADLNSRADISVLAKKIAASVQKGSGPPNVTMGVPLRPPPPLVAAGWQQTGKSGGPPALQRAPLTPPPAHVTPPPAHVTPPPAHVTPPPAHVTPPPAHGAPESAALQNGGLSEAEDSELSAEELRLRYSVFTLRPPPAPDPWQQFQIPRHVRPPWAPPVGVVPPALSPYSVPPTCRPPSADSAGSPLPPLELSMAGPAMHCPYCPQELSEPDVLHDHILSHAPHITWTCPYCHLPNQMGKESVASHISSAHPGRRVVYLPFGVPV